MANNDKKVIHLNISNHQIHPDTTIFSSIFRYIIIVVFYTKKYNILKVNKIKILRVFIAEILFSFFCFNILQDENFLVNGRFTNEKKTERGT